MSQLDALFANPDAWIDALPEYQRDTVKELLKNKADFDSAAQSWLTASASNNAPFSSVPTPAPSKTFLNNVKAEIRKLLCGDEKYKAEREGIFGQISIGHVYLVGVIATAISPFLGVAAPIISPVVAIILTSMGKVSLNAWCAIPTADNSNDVPPPSP